MAEMTDIDKFSDDVLEACQKKVLPIIDAEGARGFIRGMDAAKVIIRHESSLTQDTAIQLVLDRILKSIDEQSKGGIQNGSEEKNPKSNEGSVSAETREEKPKG